MKFDCLHFIYISLLSLYRGVVILCRVFINCSNIHLSVSKEYFQSFSCHTKGPCSVNFYTVHSFSYAPNYKAPDSSIHNHFIYFFCTDKVLKYIEIRSRKRKPREKPTKLSKDLLFFILSSPAVCIDLYIDLYIILSIYLIIMLILILSPLLLWSNLYDFSKVEHSSR